MCFSVIYYIDCLKENIGLYTFLLPLAYRWTGRRKDVIQFIPFIIASVVMRKDYDFGAETWRPCFPAAEKSLVYFSSILYIS